MIWNKTGQPQTLYVKFSVGELGSYTVQAWRTITQAGWLTPLIAAAWLLSPRPWWLTSSLCHCCSTNRMEGWVHFVMTVGTTTASTCELTQAEITLQNNWGTPTSPNFHEGSDISLVNGFNYPVTIVGPYSQSQDLKPKVAQRTPTSSTAQRFRQ